MGGYDYVWSFYLGGALAYLIGSIPFGLILTRLAGLGDIRKIGSGNVGATNVLRTGNKKLAALVLVLDAVKGALAAWLGWGYGPDMALIAGAAAVIGHVAPVWLLFKGGKGVATTLGVLYAVHWPLGLIACAMWLLTAFALRYSSLAALIALASAPGFALLFGEPRIAMLAGFLAVVVIAKHWQNIARLIKGTELKIKLKRD
ncbi:MAG: glycerol-3-phosphate 1-O-acyltransferase [Alphaproteobacteria bacterium]|nr:glycerol-3-phosphate 1-O-acyltransferase [Alphaproteobacteria bacterium]